MDLNLSGKHALVCGGSEGIGVGDVGHQQAMSLGAVVRQRVDHGLQCRLAACQHGDIGAQLGEFDGGGAADAFGAAADQCVFAGEIQVHALIPVVQFRRDDSSRRQVSKHHAGDL